MKKCLAKLMTFIHLYASVFPSNQCEIRSVDILPDDESTLRQFICECFFLNSENEEYI